MSAGKYIKLNIGTEVLTLKATVPIFARLLVIDRSSRENVDLEEVIGMHAFAYTNKVLMSPDGYYSPQCGQYTESDDRDYTQRHNAIYNRQSAIQ